MSDSARQLMEKIDNQTAKVCILGLGYVGLPLSKALLENGFDVIGFDVDQRKIDSIERGHAYIEHLGQEFFDFLKATEKFKGTSDKADLVEADAILICVPTPLGKHNDPDLSYVLSSKSQSLTQAHVRSLLHDRRGESYSCRRLRSLSMYGN